MAPAIPSAKQTLSYGLYACDFDPLDADRLIVGGGGGASRTGVGNKITLLDTSAQDAVHVAGEIELSRDEDSVATLVVGQRKDRASLVYAGVNSSEGDMKKGKNEHFRVFEIGQASKARSGVQPRMAELSRSSLFSSTDTASYQRLLRISPAFAATTLQVGAAATGTTGVSKGSEIAVFDSSATGVPNPRPRGKLELAKEVTDLDVVQVDEGQWQLAYCDGYELSVADIGEQVDEDPSCAYTMTENEAIGLNVRPAFRSVRYLTSQSVLTVSNLPRAAGALLHGFRFLGKPGSRKARLAASAKLPKSVARATGLAVRNLSPPAAPGAAQGNTQFAIAVAAQDYSITLYTMDYQVVGDVALMANLYPITTLKGVHPSPISGLAFSNFIPPKNPTMRALHLKLASIGSMGNTVVVHSLPLRRQSDKPASAAARRAGPPRPSRYVVALKSKAPGATSLFVAIAVIMCLLAVLLQGALEVQGLSRPHIGARSIVPERWHRPLVPAAPPAGDFLSSLLAQESTIPAGERIVLTADSDAGDDEAQTLRRRGGGIGVEAHDVGRHGSAREWAELTPAQRAEWRQRLRDAGHWGEEMGEAVFKGVFFAELAGAVGQMVAG